MVHVISTVRVQPLFPPNGPRNSHCTAPAVIPTLLYTYSLLQGCNCYFASPMCGPRNPHCMAPAVISALCSTRKNNPNASAACCRRRLQGGRVRVCGEVDSSEVCYRRRTTRVLGLISSAGKFKATRNALVDIGRIV